LIKALLFAALALGGCGGGDDSEILALVNGEAIHAADLERELKLASNQASPQARSQAMEELIDQALMLQEALNLNVSISPQELENQLALARAGTPLPEFRAGLKARGLRYDEWKELLRRRSLCDELVRRQIRSKIVVKPQDLKDYYWEQVTRFRRSKNIRLRQMVVKSPAAGRKALAELSLGEPFAAVASRHSQGPEAAEGGDLGWVHRKALPSSLAHEAFELKKGSYSGLVPSPYGWHILYAEDIRPPQALSLDQAAPQIMEALLREREQPLYRDWLAGLRAKAEIRRFEIKRNEP
jgi:parvulin-like peptidyl-prolyl isomerase